MPKDSGRWALAVWQVAALLLSLTALPLASGSPQHGSGQERPANRNRPASTATNQLSPVPSHEGWIIPPNSAGDGDGCVAFWDRVPTGRAVAPLAKQPTVAACCRSCRATPDCNAWISCPEEGGCDLGANFSNIPPLHHTECMLLHQGLSAPETGRPVVAIAAPGLIGGAPITASAAPIEGYELLLGHGFFNRYDYPCADSVAAGSCFLRGTPQDLAPRCNEDPLCRIMIYLPHGWDYVAPPLTDFKGGAGLMVNAADTTLNPNAAAYLKLAPPPPLLPSKPGSPGSPLRGATLHGTITAGVVTAACGMAAVLAAKLLQRRRRQDLLHKAPSGADITGSTAAGEGSQLVAGEKPPRSRTLHDSAQDEVQHPPSGGHSEEDRTANWVAQRDSMAAYSKGPPSPPASGVSTPPWHHTSGKALPSKHSAHSQRSGGSGGLGAGGPTSGRSTLPEQAVGGSSGSAEAAAAGAGEARPHRSGGSAPVAPRPGQEASWEAGIEALLAAAASGAPRQLGRDTSSSSLGSPSASQLHSILPEVPWSNEVVEFEAIEFSKRPDGAYHELGSGGFGVVYKVVLDGVQQYAAKVLDLGLNLDMHATFLREASLLRRLRHRNIVGFRGVCISEGKGILLMELMEGGDLYDKIPHLNRSTKERTFGWYGRGRRVALDVARGVHYLHSLHLTHFDIKANNVLLTRDLTAKIADMGFSKLMSNTHHSIRDGRTGTFAYMAPELLMGRKCTQSVDIYSFGLVLWEICSGEHPMRGQNRQLRVPEDCPQEVSDLYWECISEDPDARPSAKDVVLRLTSLVVPPGAVDRP